MGFFSWIKNKALKLGRIISNVAPYVAAGARTLINNPGIIGELAGLATGAAGIGAGLASGVGAGPSLVAGGALATAGTKTFGDIKKAFSKELSKEKGRLRMIMRQKPTTAAR